MSKKFVDSDVFLHDEQLVVIISRQAPFFNHKSNLRLYQKRNEILSATYYFGGIKPAKLEARGVSSRYDLFVGRPDAAKCVRMFVYYIVPTRCIFISASKNMLASRKIYNIT